MPLPRVANLLPDSFQTVRLACAINLPISATGDVLINGNLALPINAKLYKVTEVVVWNPLVNGVSGSVSSGALGLFTAAGASGTVVANASLTPTQTTGTTSAQDMTITAAATTTYTAGGLYVNVGTAVAGATVNICVYGQVLIP